MTTILTLVTNSNSEPIKQEKEELTNYVDLVGYEEKYQISNAHTLSKTKQPTASLKNQSTILVTYKSALMKSVFLRTV